MVREADGPLRRGRLDLDLKDGKVGALWGVRDYLGRRNGTCEGPAVGWRLWGWATWDLMAFGEAV